MLTMGWASYWETGWSLLRGEVWLQPSLSIGMCSHKDFSKVSFGMEWVGVDMPVPSEKANRTWEEAQLRRFCHGFPAVCRVLGMRCRALLQTCKHRCVVLWCWEGSATGRRWIVDISSSEFCNLEVLPDAVPLHLLKEGWCWLIPRKGCRENTL